MSNGCLVWCLAKDKPAPHPITSTFGWVRRPWDMAWLRNPGPGAVLVAVLAATVGRLPSAVSVSGSAVGRGTTDCTVIQQANCVSGTEGLENNGSTATVKYLGTLQTPTECRDACTRNSTDADPCHSWAFYYPDSPSQGYAGNCYGRHDRFFAPHEGIPRERNHVCTAVSCQYPVPPSPPAPPAPRPPPVHPLPPLPPRQPAAVDSRLAPIAYLGNVDGDNFTAVCRFQVRVEAVVSAMAANPCPGSIVAAAFCHAVGTLILVSLIDPTSCASAFLG